MDSRRPRRAENGHANGDGWQSKETLDYNETLINELLQGREDPSLRGLDMGMIKRKSYDRTRAAMMAVNPSIASQVLPQTDNKSEQEKAAIRIQSHMRGYIARRQYCDLLYEQYEKEEQERLEKTRQQVEEGELLVENYKLKAEMDENDCLRRNQRRNVDYSAVTIQRAWRDYRRRKSGHSTKPVPTPNPLSQVLVNMPDSNFMIRTNPFQQIRSHAVEDDDEDDQIDIFNDSLEQATDEYHRNISTSSNYDLLGSEQFDLDSAGLDSVQMEFPSPTTDWESIESCLNSEGDIKDTQQMEYPELADKYLTDFSIKAKDLQICFVDDALSDDGDEDGLEIKEYVIDKQDVSDDEKRDSGCVAGDEEEKESFSIKTLSPDDLVRSSVSEKESQHVMLELLRHEDDQEKKLTVQGWTVEKLCNLTLDEIKALRDNLAQLIQAQNEMLVTELMMRDSLHLKQDSMLMEVEDTTKSAQRLYQEKHSAKKFVRR
ncbi:uncharacterized protein LOC116293929 isoform X2 [Actinia tenebrosa]|uniref:Uncharacterized protein LOC116293929 isoform X2 n=1 Tax=Actinia tenebrosa TaxID=6105 RepID=A0A6P8HQB1_ACTTE|nr:uncharacterized protein LOC116293929 isoform X2 [Actinia tenebrosa]